MFSKLLVAAVLVAVVVGQAPTHAPWTHHPRPDRHDMVSIDEYSAAGCSGTPIHHYSVNADQCLPGNGDHNVSSVEFHCFLPRTGDVCASIAHDAGANCTDLSHKAELPCDMCVRDERDASVGYHRADCDATAGTVNISMRCDSTCNNCRESHMMMVGQCMSYDNGQKFAELLSVGQCHGTVFEETFAEKDCHGDMHHYMWANGQCAGTWKFTCMAGTMPPALSYPVLQRGK